MSKQYLKMADVFDGVVSTSFIDDESINEMARGDGAGDYHVLQDDAYWMLIERNHAEYAAHAINSHDELVAEVERLRNALECATNQLREFGVLFVVGGGA